MTSRLVSLMEILEHEAHTYVHAMGIVSTAAWRLKNESTHNLDAVLGILQGELERFRTNLVRGAQRLTLDLVDDILRVLATPALLNLNTPQALADRLIALQSLFCSELKHQLFLQFPSERREFYEKPRAGWEDVITRFPNTVIDVEEMRRCFALSRYPACVFHSAQVLEIGLIDFGQFLAVPDPRPGWTAVTQRLANIVKTPYEKRTGIERTHFQLLEQMHGLTEALKNAWRNKISHANERLTLLSSDFTPDIAEEIMVSSRGFMRRLATELPP